MKGLFIKDIALMKNNKRILSIIFFTVIFLMITGINSSFLMGYIPFICCTLTMGTISYDEYENGLPFLLTLPISRKEYVKEKYFLGFFTGGIGFLLSAAAATILQWIKTPEMDIFQWLLFCGYFLIFLAIFLALMIPIQIKYGSDKGKIVFLGIFLSIIALCYLATQMFQRLSFDFRGIKWFLAGVSDWQILVLSMGLAVVILGISHFFSIRIIEKKEF
ncbi:ABC-2 transporter permease [Blautia sp. Marseille-P3201T]|mgnify:CR=1 FL=1|uniref:ABC-2 transporter permease n=1 Tax=Blautia sp. Marseille-P3201T TaxID=1907659 RepID=UPI0009306A46|nr:ABC-2 transporter permease [Blautia sp. Marseille-P3201T]